jgi:DNA polymerase-3 subunit gamma/tau
VPHQPPPPSETAAPAEQAGDPAAPVHGRDPGRRRPPDPSSISEARGAIQGTRPADAARAQRKPDTSDEDADRDDPDAEDHALGGAQLLERELGASIIEEIKHD